jgi:NADH-quinone oxidoreductase subunit E
VYVCTNISCSLNGADELYERLHDAVGDDDPDINLRHFECLGACDIAPMASVDGVYVGPIALDEVDELIEDVRSGRPPLERKQLRYRPYAESLPMDGGARDQAAGTPHLATADASLPPEPTSYGREMPDTSEGPVAPIEQAPGGPVQREDREDQA